MAFGQGAVTATPALSACGIDGRSRAEQAVAVSTILQSHWFAPRARTIDTTTNACVLAVVNPIEETTKPRSRARPAARQITWGATDGDRLKTARFLTLMMRMLAS